MATYRIVVLGDSVNWGRGLLPAEKFHSLVQAAIPDAESTMFAHSGATIGVGVPPTEAAVDGEVPTAYPTILQQVSAFNDAPEAVDLVLVNGGINDINFRNILNPLTDSAHLKDQIRQYCFQSMKTLLEAVVATFTKPSARIIVTSYYPILSHQTQLPLVGAFLAVHGLALPSFLDVLDGLVFAKIIANCEQFYVQSNHFLQRAINQVNAAAGGVPRLFFAQPPFGPENAALAPQAWLWGVNADLSPQDPVQAARHIACDAFEPDLIRRLICYRASAGHPNIEGANQYALAILALLS
ncbi:MAG TPA: SGNH/GDSL hydrolase family protein [Blastocatellia bacterium]|nr:SGNH/GDSL hydrolase family protein [Blastocatellia bacterium]